MPFITASTTINKVQNTVAGNTPPTSPTIGQMWNDTSATPPILKVWNGSEWVPVNMSIKQLDPVSFDEINRIINDTINDVNQSRDDINHALNQAQEAIEKAEFNNEKITAIEKTQSDDGKKIVELQANYNGVKQSVSDLETKQESDRIQLAGQISETVKNQEATNQRVSTAEHDILSLTTSDGKQNQRLDTAEESLKIISKKTDDNTEVINQTKQTADINSQKIVSTDGRVSNVEQTLTEQSQTIADNTGRINQAIQDIDSAERTISDINGRVSKVEQKADGITSTVSNVQSQLNNKANKTDLDKTNQVLSGKADTSFVNDKVHDITSSDVNNLFIDSEFYNLDAIKSNWYRSNLKVLTNETYVDSRILYWDGTGSGWGYIQFQPIAIPSTLNNKVTVGFNYRYSTEDQFLASFYFMNADGSQILKKHEVWFKGTAEQANFWQTFSMTSDIPDGTDHIDFKIFANGSKILNFSRPRLYAGTVDWGYNINPAYSQNQIENKVDGGYVDNKINSISVGGTNLLNGTDNFSAKYWLQRSGYPVTQLLPISPKISDAPSITQMDKVTSVTSGKIYGEVFLEKDQPYTVSVYIKGDSGTVGRPEFAFLNLSNNDHYLFTSGQKETIGTNWKRVTKTINGTGKKYTNFYMRLSETNLSSTNAVYIAGYQLEKGNKPTSYSPSPEDKANQDDLISQLKNRSNLWPDSTFENKNLSTYTTIPDGNNLVHIVTNGAKSTANDSPREYGVEYRKQNSSNKALRFEGRTDGNRDCFLKDDYMFDVSDGDVFNVSYDFYKQASSTATVGFKCIKYDGSTVDWLGVFGNNNSGSHWWHKDGQITIPSGKGIVKVLPYAALGKTTNTSDYLYIDNIVIKLQDSKQNAIDTQVKSQQTQINQTAGKVDIIASENGNANAYLNINSNGDINIGANHRLVLSANTYVTDGFTFSANSIKAGQISGSDMTIDLNTGIITNQTSQKNFQIKKGEIYFEDADSHFSASIAASSRRIDFCANDAANSYGYALDMTGSCPSIYNNQSRLDVLPNVININGEIGSTVTVGGGSTIIKYNNCTISCRSNDIKFEMDGEAWYMKKQTFNGNTYPALLSSSGNSGIAFGGNVPYVKSMGKWYSLNQIITKTGVQPVD